jgi:hypothetical protein
MLFSLWELGNLTVKFPVHDELEAAVGPSATLMFLQLYTPFVKAMEERVPLVARPHLLSYMLGEDYVRRNRRFKKIWDEVHSERTRKELMEIVSIGEPFEARLEVVLMGRDLSFLSEFNHVKLAQAVVDDRLLVKVRLDFVAKEL